MSDTYDVLNPATEEVVTTVSLASPEEVDFLVARAKAAFPGWRDTAPADRARLLRAMATLVEAHREELANLEVQEAGHTIGNALWEADNVRNVLNYYAGGAERLLGHQIPVPGGIDITFHEPFGVVGIIVPWNFPMPIAGWGFAPALAAGNTVVLKPAEVTPLTAMRLAELALEAGIPEGVFTVMPGKGRIAGQRLVEHPDVRNIVFTGSTDVGIGIMKSAASNLKRVTLELGGKSPTIIFADADVEAAAKSAPMAVFDNSGQDCCARSRILVERSIYDDVLAHMESVVMGMKVGDPTLASTDMGPLITAAQRDTVASFVPPDAPIMFQGDAPTGKGFWFPPTVLAPITKDDRQYTDEIFGPVAVVIPFDNEAHAIELANGTDYGLAASIFTKDVGRAFRVARAVESGVISVNSHSSVRYWTPFGGFKMSGIGRELGPDAIEHFTETKNVFVSTAE
ncbi:MAG: aldehyde dehydrogenase family protein [Actinobacteria bacterium]|uniref:Unannotated protein n=1 Tax=freshwater metagenome TaxID=449393 RepID=A0A6J5YXJ2_9ZZZZ|nr:aldehyde dehydrogenase family protein [Actinomycetota bacterium]